MRGKSRLFGYIVSIALCTAALAFGGRRDEVTLVLIPREDASVRIGMDIANQFPSLLISYKIGAGGVASFHGWTGTEWVNVTEESFRNGGFFPQGKGPGSALIIEKQGAAFPSKLIPPESWCPAVYKITTTETRPLLHLLGRYYDFKFKEWEAFAEAYRQPLDSINPEGLNVSWYHRRLKDQKRSSNAVGAADLQYWIAVRHPMPIIEPPVEEEKAPAESTDESAPTETVKDPFAADAPAAVVLGADDADAAEKKKTGE